METEIDLNTTLNVSGRFLFTYPMLHQFFTAFVENNSVFDSNVELALIALYVLVIVVGTAGNSLVIISVIRTPAMRTARNIFILNLACSDLTLCLITMPFTLVSFLNKFWLYGETLCKLTSAFEGTNVFVSVSSITAIAMDRYQVIVYPTSASMQKLGAALALTAIWVCSFVLASPLLFYRQYSNVVDTLKGQLESKATEETFSEVESDFHDVGVCVEDPNLQDKTINWKLLYGVSSLVVTYLLPIVLVSVFYWRISSRIRHRMRFKSSGPTPGTPSHAHPSETVSLRQDGASSDLTQRLARKREEEERRQRRTTHLLIAIWCVFAVSWLPLYIFNIISDTGALEHLEGAQFMIIYAICHLFSMSSACSNPILYGYLNENFRKEFKYILCWLVSLLPRVFRSMPCYCCEREVRAGHQRVPVIINAKSNSNENQYRVSGANNGNITRDLENGNDKVLLNGFEMEDVSGHIDNRFDDTNEEQETPSCVTQSYYLSGSRNNVNTDQHDHGAATQYGNQLTLPVA